MLARFSLDADYLPAVIALWIAIDLLVVLWLGASRRSAEDDSRAITWSSASRRPAAGGERVPR